MMTFTKSSFPEIVSIREGEDYEITRYTFKGATHYVATYYADGWKTCSLAVLAKMITKVVKAPTLEELEAKIAE